MAGIISAVLTAGGAEMEIIGGKKLEKTQSKLYKEAGEQAIKVANAEADTLSRRQSGELGGIRAESAGSGITFSGSALMVDESIAREMALNEKIVRFGGQLRATELKREKIFNKLTGKLGRRVTAISGGQKAFSQASSDFSSGGYFGSSSNSSGFSSTSGQSGTTFNHTANNF